MKSPSCLRVIGLLALALAAGLVGCTQRPIKPVANPLPIDPREYNRLFHAAVTVLRNDGFDLEEHDYRFGRIIAVKNPSPTIFEPWDRTNTTFDQAIESTLSDQRRVVNIFFEPVNPTPAAKPPAPSAATKPPVTAQPVQTAPAVSHPTEYRLRVEVILERRELPERRLSGSTASFRIFSSLTAVPAELQRRGITGPYWRPVGRDPYLEQRLLVRIVRASVIPQSS